MIEHQNMQEKLLEKHLLDSKQKLLQNITNGIDDPILYVSIFSGVPVNKINKQKVVDAVYDYACNSDKPTTDTLATTKDIIDLIWSISIENNQLKEKKLQDCAPNSKVKIKFMQMLKEFSQNLSELLNISIPYNIIKDASSLIAPYIDKFIYAVPTPEQEMDMKLILILLSFTKKENEEKIINKMGLDFYKQLMVATALYLSIFENALCSNSITPNSPHFIEATNNVIYYIDILIKQK